MTPAASSAVWVVIVTYCATPWIRPLLNSLRASRTPVMTVVVDNASTDDTTGIISRDYPEVHLLAQEVNAGFGAGNNVGIEYALKRGARYVYLVNQDGSVPHDSIEKLLQVMEADPEIGIATPLHCTANERQLDRKTYIGYLRNHAAEFFSDAALNQPIKPCYSIRGINAAAWFVRRRVFERVGGFDPIFFMYGEDDDMINRCAHHGERFVLVPGSRFIHLRGKSPQGGADTFLTRVRKSRMLVRSQLIARMKAPVTSLPHAIAIAISEGILAPLQHVIIHRQYEDFFASCAACMSVLATDLPRLTRHRKRCEQTGATFLNLTPDRTTPPD